MEDLRLAGLDPRFPQRSVVPVGALRIGVDFALIAGPCSVESEAAFRATAEAVKAAGANMLRGGVFKPRTSPYSFQGLGLPGLRVLARIAGEVGLPVVTEVVDPRDAAWVADSADLLQIGTRNMQNFALLKEVGRIGRPVLLKRGMHSTLSEWLYCAEYILAEGNPHVVLCERGIRSFETYTRNTLDLSMVPAIRATTHLPIVVDPSHATGRPALIGPMSLAAVAAGADGVMIEVHHDPAVALSDREQALTPAQFVGVADKVKRLRAFMVNLHHQEATTADRAAGGSPAQEEPHVGTA
jgi:3-deoxy-7-phosphoheptulonate synthase